MSFTVAIAKGRDLKLCVPLLSIVAGPPILIVANTKKMIEMMRDAAATKITRGETSKECLPHS